MARGSFGFPFPTKFVGSKQKKKQHMPHVPEITQDLRNLAPGQLLELALSVHVAIPLASDAKRARAHRGSRLPAGLRSVRVQTYVLPYWAWEERDRRERQNKELDPPFCYLPRLKQMFAQVAPPTGPTASGNPSTPKRSQLFLGQLDAFGPVHTGGCCSQPSGSSGPPSCRGGGAPGAPGARRPTASPGRTPGRRMHLPKWPNSAHEKRRETKRKADLCFSSL